MFRSIVIASALCATSTLADNVGLTEIEIDAAHHGRSMSAAIWYPTSADNLTPSRVAENPVFVGVDATVDAPVAEGRHPVVLVSHGTGGTYRSLAWLSAGLAERGAIVVAVDHPNGTWSDFDLSKAVFHWTRAQDLSTALDALGQNPKFAAHMDAERVMATGFSFGGWTALSLGGLRANHEGIVKTCTSMPEMSMCEAFMSPRVNLPGIDKNDWNASYADARVTHVAAIDPGFVWGLSSGDMSNVKTTLVSLGTGEDRLLAADFDQSGFRDLVPQASVLAISPANHFTAMPVCQPAGAAILKEEDDDPVCTDPEGTNRYQVHLQIIDRLARDLGL